jgi:hypothetical protein
LPKFNFVKLRILIAFCFFAIGYNASAQTDTLVVPREREPIATDRPDQTETPSIVPRGMLQLENGFVYEKTDADNATLVSPTILFKYGVDDNFELRLITEYQTADDGTNKISGINPVLVGFKVRLAEEKGIVPTTSFIAHLLLPDLASKELKADYYASEFRFTMQHTLSENMSLGYNLGAEWDGFTPNATFVYTLTTGFSFTEKFGGYVEVFGFAPQNDKADHSFDGGITYLISNDFMIDTSVGVGLTENAPDYFLSVGFSFRL